jgi:hypothetical protein
MATYLATLTVPAGTALTSPVRQELKVIPGTVTRLRLYVPPGPRHEVYLRLAHGGVQILPARAGTWWRPDAVTLDYDMNYQVGDGDAVFHLEGASPLATFQHSFDFELRVADTQGQEQPRPQSFLAGLLGG